MGGPLFLIWGVLHITILYPALLLTVPLCPTLVAEHLIVHVGHLMGRPLGPTLVAGSVATTLGPELLLCQHGPRALALGRGHRSLVHKGLVVRLVHRMLHDGSPGGRDPEVHSALAAEARVVTSA